MQVNGQDGRNGYIWEGALGMVKNGMWRVRVLRFLILVPQF